MIWHNYKKEKPENDKAYLVIIDLPSKNKDKYAYTDILKYKSSGTPAGASKVIYQNKTVIENKSEKDTPEERLLKVLFEPLTVETSGFYREEYYLEDNCILIKENDDDIMYWAEIDFELPKGYLGTQNKFEM